MPRVPTSVVPLAAMEIFRAWETRMIPEEPRTVLCFGRLSAYKGIHVLQEAMPLVAREVPDVRFIVAGAPVPNYTIPHFPMLPNGGQVEPHRHNGAPPVVGTESACDDPPRSPTVSR